MNFSNFLPSTNITSSEIKNESREEFFSIKRVGKRMKQSTTFNESNVQTEKCELKNQQDLLERQCQGLGLKEKREQLVSTFGSDSFLSFKCKQPKRKKNFGALKSLEQHPQEESDQQTQKIEFNSAGTNGLSEHSQKQINLAIQHKFCLKDFVFLAKVGEGTYSQVYRAIERKSGFLCSLKILNKQKMRNLKVEQNLFSQVKIHFFLNHPHIVKLYGCFDDEDSVYLICELATDNNIYERLNSQKSRKNKGFPIELVSSFVGQISHAIDFMHSNFIIHRDVKPQNMLVTFSDTVKLCDFGWSIYNPDKTLRTTLCGTPLYLAPQLIQQDSYDESVDVWALGILTFELLTNQIPFKVKSIRDLSKVISQNINFKKIKCEKAIDFISSALRKKKQERKSIRQLCNHPFLFVFHQQQTQ